MIDLNGFVSPQGKFTDALNGQVIRGDGVHFTEAGSAMVVELVDTADREGRWPAGDPDPVDDTDRPDSRGLWAKYGSGRRSAARVAAATANSTGVVGVIWSVTKKCDSSRPGADAGALGAERPGRRPGSDVLVAPHVPARAAPCAAGRARRASAGVSPLARRCREVGVELVVALEADARHVVEEQREQRLELVGLEQVHVERVLEVGGRGSA